MIKRILLLLLILALCCPILASGDSERAGGSGSAAGSDGSAAGSGSAGCIALTFDDGPSGAVTEDFLKTLEDHGAACTFFVCGYRIEDFPTDLSSYAAHGHELGVHGWSHDYLRGMEPQRLQTELYDTAQLIAELSGTWPRWLRPPGGFYDQGVRSAAEALDLSIALWSVDPEDWANHDPRHITQHILSRVGDGDVVLLHDIFDTSRGAALEIIDTLRARGYELVTLSELAARKGSVAEAGAVYSCFG